MAEPVPPLRARAPCPPSDVPLTVGYVGLAGLVVWAVICQYWGAIATALALPGPRAALAGPNAALVAILAAALPMVAWSLLVDKVHRNADTGIDWAHPRPFDTDLDISLTKLAGLWTTWGGIAFFYCVERWYWGGQWLFAMRLLGVLVVPMVVLSVPYVLWLDRVLVNPRDAAWHFGAMLIGREAYDREEAWKHLRSWAIKGFYCAFMFSILPGGWASVVGFDWRAALANPVAVGNWLINGLFLVDVGIGTVGYVLTLRPLGAQIRSGNPHLAGWVAALICYPPFVLMGNGGPLDYHPGTAEWSSWLAGFPALQWLWVAMMVALTAVYAAATMAFGIRFSNLTYRGVLTAGPYRLCRHPAYLSKNAFWWLSTLPFLSTTHSWVDAVRNCTILAAVSGVYFWRAKTEEMHLLAEDAKYREYHAWMAENAAITRGLAKLGHWLAGGRAEPVRTVQPAE